MTDKDAVRLEKFAGLRNTVGEERLAASELVAAFNVDIDDSGALRRRRGTTRVATGDWHSLFAASTRMLAVKDGDLVEVAPDFSARVLEAGVGADELAWCEVGEAVHFSSRTRSGVIAADGTVRPWGERGPAGQWLSPVVEPSDALPAVRGRLLGDPPRATALAAYKGRIWLAAQRTLWATELFLYDAVDRTRNYLYFESPITALGAVSDGLYVGTESGAFFLQGTLAEMRRTPITISPVLRGSMLAVPAELVKKESPSRNAVLFLTESGLCAGFDGGECYNLTQTRVIFPDSDRVVPLLRRQDGLNQYVAATETSGSPSSNARIGDYVDAEIRRFKGA